MLCAPGRRARMQGSLPGERGGYEAVKSTLTAQSLRSRSSSHRLPKSHHKGLNGTRSFPTGLAAKKTTANTIKRHPGSQIWQSDDIVAALQYAAPEKAKATPRRTGEEMEEEEGGVGTVGRGRLDACILALCIVAQRAPGR